MEPYMEFNLSVGRMMKVIIPLLSLFPFVYANKRNLILTTNRCPGNASQWEERGHQFQCDVTKNISYHCILDSDDRLIEACVKKYNITQKKGGCPWLLEKDGRLLLGLPLTECPPYITGCPEINHDREYTSDSLYLYPKCLVPTDLRNNTPIPTQSLTHVTQKYTDASPTKIAKSLEKNCTEEDSSCTPYTVVMIIFILTTIASMGYIGHVHRGNTNILRRRNRKGKTPEEEESFIESPKPSGEVNQNERAPSSSHDDLRYSDVDEQWHQKGPFIENKASKWLDKRLKELRGREIRPLFLHGISGSGKSTVVRHCLGEDIYIVKASKRRHLMKSLKELADSMSIKFDEDETKLKDMIIDISKQLQDIILLIDDVTDEGTMELVYPLLQKVQCIVTTTNENLVYDVDSSDQLEVKGLSVEEASELFKEKNFKVNHKNKDFKQLISILEGSPSGILSVIKHMKEKKVSVTRVLRYIMQNKVHFDNETEDGKLFNSLNYLLTSIMSAHPEISSLVLALQFLSTENIPICLLYALAAYEATGRLPEESDIDFDKAESVVNTFISALQEVSFGEVIGVDDERKINVPTVVQITVKKSSQRPEGRRRLLLNLLKCMSWLFVKDHGDRNDHRRCMDLLPHAIELMHHFPPQKSEITIEESLVFIQVCDQVRYTYEVLGHEFKENKYAECLMKHVLEKVLCVEKDYFIEKFQNETENMETIAKEIRHNFRRIAQSNEGTISNLAVDYIKNKVRSENEQDTLRSKTGEENLFAACRLTSNGKRCLEDKHLLVKEPLLLARIFVYEILITALRTFGRFNLVQEKDDKLFDSFVLLIKSLAKHECEKLALRNFKSIRTVGVEFIEMDAACSGSSNLRSVIEQSVHLLSDDTKYFKYGLFVQCPKDNLNHKLRCKCLMLQCYRKLKEESVLEECAKSIKELFDKDRATCMKASYSQKAKQELVHFYIEKEKYKEAIDFLKQYEHEIPSEEVTSKSDCMDIMLQCQCYQKLKMFDERSNFLRRFEFKVPTDEVYAKEIVEKIKETEQQV